jgi:CRISPR/Cas system-associated exonuclease Cas4 (RecB family)
LVNWEKNLLNRNELWTGQFIPVYAISDFIFCRRDPERFLQNLQKQKTSGMLNGITKHEELEAAFVRVKIQETVRAIKGNRPVSFREFRLITKHKEYLVAGQLDEIYFKKSKPIRLIDDKYPESLRNFESSPYPNQEAQLLLYGFLLKQTGFDIKDLRIFLVKHFQGQEREFEVYYDKRKVEDILTSCETVQKLYYSVLPKSDRK